MEPTIPTTEPVNPFPHGWRWVPHTTPEGQTEWEQVALTAEDVLHPQEEDEVPVRPIHEIDCRYLATVFNTRSFGPPQSWVAVDLLIDWGVEGIRNHSPDLALFVGLSQPPDLEKGTLRLKELGGRCLLAVEVVSLERRANDVVHKFDHYWRLGIPEYVLIDQEVDHGPRRVVGYDWSATGYVRRQPDAQGRVLLTPIGLWLGVKDGRAVCYDDATGRELGDYAAVVRAQEETERTLEQADRRSQEQDRAIEEAVLEMHREARAREDAERREREQARAREDAERREREQARAREEAERLARQEAERAAQAEQRLRQLEEALRRLQQGDAGPVA